MLLSKVSDEENMNEIKQVQLKILEDPKIDKQQLKLTQGEHHTGTRMTYTLAAKT